MKETAMSKVAATVLSTTPALNAQVQEFVSKYHVCVQKSAESTLDLACLVNEAKNMLSKKDFVLFRTQIGADQSKDSYIKKLLGIAKSSVRLNALKDKLPPNYTTLYTLAKMDDDVFLKVVKADVISPRMTASTLSRFNPKKSKPKTEKLQVTFNLNKLSEKEKCLAVSELRKIFEQFKLDIPKSLQMPLIEKLTKVSNAKLALIQDTTLELATA